MKTTIYKHREKKNNRNYAAGRFFLVCRAVV